MSMFDWLRDRLGAPSEPAQEWGAPAARDTGFDAAFERVIGHEGGYVDHPDDPGGATNLGITERVAREHGYTGSMRLLTREQAREIYRVGYWERAQADQYAPAIGFQLFDAAVNHGIGNAIRFLQRAVGVADDGQVGQVTVAAVRALDPAEVIARFNAERLEFYAKLTTWPSFGRGWARRIAGNLRYGATDT
jgi:lysozyme family protein